MKKVILICLITVFLLNIAAPGYCSGPIRKLGRGFWNLLTFPFEIPNRMTQVNKASGMYESVTYGFLEGLGMTCVRLAAGVFEVVTFPFPLPEKYGPVLNDPEFLFWEVKE